MIRVLLVDDQDLVRAGLRGILRESFGFEIAGECADGSEALAAVEQTNPDIVLMDVRMRTPRRRRRHLVAASQSCRAFQFSLSPPSTTTKRSPGCCAPGLPDSSSKVCPLTSSIEPYEPLPPVTPGSTPQ